MSVYQRPSTPLSAPTSPLQISFQNKSQQDVIKYKNSSISLNVPQAFSAGGIITPPETPAKKQQHATSGSYATLIDCPISKASFLLAQASLATALAGRTSSSTEFKFRDPEAFGAEAGTETRTRTLRFGTGLDGCFTSTRGFLGCQAMPPTNVINPSIRNSPRSLGQVQRLPASLKAWEVVHGNLPRLLRARRVRHAVDALRERATGDGRDAWDTLEQRHLARAALVLSALAHAYMFGEEQGKSKECEGRLQVPRHVLDPWGRVCTALGRKLTGRVPADDVLNNAMGNAAFNLSSAYFGLPEERLSSGLQGTMEGIFAPALSAMAFAQSGVLADQPNQVTHCLESLAATIVQCANVFEAMTLRDAATFDPVVWIKTYPAMGRAVTPGELGNSGADTPLFHALDVFIGRQDVKGDLTKMQSDRKATLPANIRAFLDALGDRAASVRDYVAACTARAPQGVSSEEQSQYRHLEAAWDGLLQMYVWFLERHRVKAIGVTGVSLNTGRHSTSSGVKSTDQCKHAGSSSAEKGKGKPNMRPEAMLSMQMKAGMASRLGGRPLWQDARIQSQTVYEGSTVVEVKLDAKLPLEAGDRVQVWPPRKRRKLNRTSAYQRRLRASTPPEDHDVPSDESVEDSDDDEAEPRFYSIARVAEDSTGKGGMTITLTVSQHSPEGLVSSFLSNAAEGTHLRLRPWPSLRFRQPQDLSVPLVLVGQGSGIGPLVGFLHERAAWAQQRRDSTGDVGELLLVIAAKTRRHVPCSLDSLEHLTRILPLTITLALSQETHHFRIRGGIRTQLPEGERRLTHHLVEHRDSIYHLVKDEGGHVFVCGSSDFGATVTSSLELGQPQQEDQGVNCFDANNYTDIPSPPAHWDRIHQDLFTAVKKPSKPHAPSSSTTTTTSSLPIITPSQLAAHNSITSSWAAIDGTVYDLTHFLTIHPGGPKTLLESAGTIADVRFAETHGGPHAQEIRGYLQQYAIGRLPPAKCPRDLSTLQITAAKLTDALVRMQNALTNNTAFDASRGSVPVYVYEDALLVFADGLDGVMAILSDVVASDATGDASELKETVAKTQTLLRRAFSDLKDGCKRYMQAAGANGSDSLLDESESLIQRLHQEPINKIHEVVNACKKGLGEIESCGSVEIWDVLEEFTTTLTSLAQNLLRVMALAEETGTGDVEQRTTCREENIYATHSAMPSVDL
ncbi:cytochrome b5-like Heme/Steroid binding domain-containing protein [Colletotrichum abscissum]|uniref:Cytochrome b5-like Heme/Steroid binding domain-containing protein n=1 Tax=Colletotrichum abscissum TaxID=1671311 RepID=A0A9P9XK02_9PEZI|nr:cytochrome b5-like Heme/Steroid binding domain-containing protein [Colletotrichum abscissum]KAI3554856.1 cytochrome b5-like Heme/Steroid binding domain-containing protein [Colletotrichum abscissum]KAK1520906.1 cytochrome b5-like Heme/Steroid binding domain-containing protein [Colletotrichum abscissum]